MSDRPNLFPPTSKKFVPDPDSLEGRLLLSRTVSFADGTSFFFPTFARLPRTGGALIQSGTALTVGVGQRTSNTVNLTNGASGTGLVEWNSRAPHTVTGVQSILVQAARSGRDQITINLAAIDAFASAAGTTTSLALPKSHSHLLHALRPLRTSGTAVQTGTVLDINVTGRKINQLAIESWNFGHLVEPQWNGSGVHTFSDVSTIIIVIRNGTNDFVGLDNSVAKGP
jgi:hypothetical protein